MSLGFFPCLWRKKHKRLWYKPKDKISILKKILNDTLLLQFWLLCLASQSLLATDNNSREKLLKKFKFICIIKLMTLALNTTILLSSPCFSFSPAPTTLEYLLFKNTPYSSLLSGINYVSTRIYTSHIFAHSSAPLSFSDSLSCTYTFFLNPFFAQNSYFNNPVKI